MGQTVDKLCPACASVLVRKLEACPIRGLESCGSLLSSLFSESHNVDLYICPNCGKVELYTAGFDAEQAAKRDKEDHEDGENQVVCPVCGATHSPLISCPSCAARSGILSPMSRFLAEGKTAPQMEDAAPKKKADKSPWTKGRKPPWEK